MRSAATSGETATTLGSKNTVLIKCFLPNGLYINLRTNPDSTLESILDSTFIEAQNLGQADPLFRDLKKPNEYSIVSVSVTGSQILITDRKLSFSEINLAENLLIFSDNECFDAGLTTLHSQILNGTGKSPTDITDITVGKPVYVGYRKSLFSYFYNLLWERSAYIEKDAFFYHAPLLIPEYEFSSDISLDSKFTQRATISAQVHINEVNSYKVYNFKQLMHNAKPSDVIRTAIKEICLQRGTSPSEMQDMISMYKDEYVMRLCGTDEYLFDDCPLKQYANAVHYIENNKAIPMELVLRNKLYTQVPNSLSGIIIPDFTDYVNPQTQSSNIQNIWNLDEISIQVRVLTISNLTFANEWGAQMMYFVRIGVFQGGESYGTVANTSLYPANGLRLNETLDLDVFMTDLPASAIICISLCAVKSTSKSTSTTPAPSATAKTSAGETSPIGSTEDLTSPSSVAPTSGVGSGENQVCVAFVNVPLFDSEGFLERGRQNFALHMLPVPTPQLSHPEYDVAGPSLSGTNHPVLAVDIESCNTSATYPKLSDFENYLSIDTIREVRAQRDQVLAPQNLGNDSDKLRLLLGRLSTEKLPYSREDREIVWASREHLVSISPDTLPILIHSVFWSSRLDAGIAYELINRWPRRPSLETVIFALLSCSTSRLDNVLSQRWTSWLDEILEEDTLLQLFLPQIVQCIVSHPFPLWPLAKWFYSRIMKSRQLFLAAFWAFQTEYRVKQAAIDEKRLKFGVTDATLPLLILESMIRCGGGLRNLISRQAMVVNALTNLTLQLQNIPDTEKRSFFKTWRHRPETVALFDSDNGDGFRCLMNPGIQLGRLQFDSCSILSSKKRPLWLCWSFVEAGSGFYEPDVSSPGTDVSPLSTSSPPSKSKQHVPFANVRLYPEYYQLIFKRGDDLRQDQLILQILRVIQSCWNAAGVDTKLQAYSCLPVATKAGFIKVVENASTIMAVQRAAQFDPKQLYRWLSEKVSHSGITLQTAVQNFTLSCAGYCVATFCLGIGDRHQENIMLADNGRIFHIDFGHFLGNVKKKMGVSRERVPFVLTNDFIHVISNCAETPVTSKEFIAFQQLCGKMYLLLREHCGRLLIVLFRCMLDANMPELANLEDIYYLNSTLCLAKNIEQIAVEIDRQSDEEALTFFWNRFSDAYEGKWGVRVDWFFHWMKHKNNTLT